MTRQRGVAFSGDVIYALPYLEMGGTEWHVLSLVKGVEWAHPPVVIAPSGPLGPAVEAAGAHLLPFQTLIGRGAKGSFPNMVEEAMALIRDRRSASGSTDPSTVASPMKPPAILHVHGGAELLWSARKMVGHARGMTSLFTAHGYFGSGVWASYWLAARWLRRYKTPMIAVSQSEKERFIRMGMPEAWISVIHNGVVDPSPATPNVEEAVREGTDASLEKPFVVGTVARMVRNKGLDVLIRAIGRLRGRGRSVRLVVFGDGPERERLSELARELGVVDDVDMPGRIPDAAQQMRNFDVFCLPSRDEAFPLVLLEAEANELPIVATAVAGIPDIVADGETGYLVPPDDVESLAGALEKVIAHPDTARQMGRASRERYLKHFTVKEMCRRTVGVYEDLIQLVT